jgi:hypothetical protein
MDIKHIKIAATFERFLLHLLKWCIFTKKHPTPGLYVLVFWPKSMKNSLDLTLSSWIINCLCFAVFSCQSELACCLPHPTPQQALGRFQLRSARRSRACLCFGLEHKHIVFSVTECCSMSRNVFEAILETGHDEDFAPSSHDDFSATDAPAGSRAKIDILASRVMRGEPLWHPEDRSDYSGLTGAVRPRA